MNKFRYVITTLCLVLLSLAAQAAVNRVNIEGIWYELKESGNPIVYEATVTRSSDNTKYSGEINIPSILEYGGISYSVTSIGTNAFDNCSGLTSVIIPNSVTSIGSYAFYRCSGLTSVSIPNLVTLIGDYAFYGCSGLTSVNIPNSITSIGDYAFYGCSGLTSVIIPNSVTSIGFCAFSGCSGLTSVIIPNSVTSIGAHAFNGCSGLKKSAYPKTCSDPFYGYGYVVAYNPEGAIIEDGFIFGPEKSSIRFAPYTLNGEYAIPNSVTSIEEGAFSGCSGLTSVIIPNSVTSIESYAFNGCSGLKKAAYPNTLYNPFTYGYVNVVAYNPEGAIIEEGFIFGPEKSSIRFAPYTLNGEYAIPNSVTSIEGGAFSGCPDLTSVIIPNSVTSIGGAAFYGCSGLTSVIIPNSVTSIGNYAFYGCDGLKKSAYPNTCKNPFDYTCRHVVAYNPEGAIFEEGFIFGPEKSSIWFVPYTLNGEYAIPNSVTSIGSHAFSSCSSLTSVIIPNSVTSIGNSAFSGCSGLTSFTIPNSVTSIESSAFHGCSGLTSVSIPDSVTSIGDYAFYGCSGLTSFIIPNLVTSIGDYAFYGCSGLTSVNIPNLVTSIGKNAFYGCSGLTSIISMATAAPKININTFEGLYSTATLLIPKKSIETYAISNWGQFDSLKYIDAEEETTTYSDGELNYFIILADNDKDKNIAIVKSGNYSDLSSVDIPERVTDNKSNNYYITGIGSAAFNGCRGLKEIHFNKNSAITIIGSYAFSNTAITSIELPSTLTKIEEGAFNWCNVLTSVTIPNSVTFIGSSAFEHCSSLASVTLGNSIKSISDETFRYCKLKRIVLPPSVETIGSSAFASNSYLDKIVMGYNVKSIDYDAFSLANNGTVYITAQVPPTVAYDVFGYNKGRLYVQGGTNLDAYYDAAPCWQKFEGYVMSEPQSLTMDKPNTIEGKAGEQFTLKATLAPANVELPYVFWRSTDPEKAYVDNDGKVTVLQNITAEDNVEIIAETLYYNGPTAKFSFATDASSVSEIVDDTTATMEVFTLQGVQILRNATREQFDNLAGGIYIVRSGKSVKKVVK